MYCNKKKKKKVKRVGNKSSGKILLLFMSGLTVTEQHPVCFLYFHVDIYFLINHSIIHKYYTRKFVSILEKYFNFFTRLVFMEKLK